MAQINRANPDSVPHSFRRLVRDRAMGIAISGTLALLAILYAPSHIVPGLAPLPFSRFPATPGIAVAAVLWCEIVKWVKRQ